MTDEGEVLRGIEGSHDDALALLRSVFAQDEKFSHLITHLLPEIITKMKKQGNVNVYVMGEQAPPIVKTDKKNVN